MSSAESSTSKRRWSLKEFLPSQLNHQLRTSEWQPGGEAEIVGASGEVGLAAGIIHPIKILVHGAVGDYAFALNDGGECEVVGDVGAACGHSMLSGSILVRGHAGPALGAFAAGGFIALHWAAEARCGMCVAGAEIVIRSDVGPQAGWAMKSGTLVIGADAKAGLGEGMTGGTIYIRGKADSPASHLREMRMKDADSLRLGLLLVRAGIKADPKDFRIYRTRSGV